MTLPIPKTKDVLLVQLKENRAWTKTDGTGAIPSFMEEELSSYSSFKCIFGIALHVPCWIFRKLCMALGLWHLVVPLAKLRINNPAWGFDSISCHRNVVFNDLGLAFYKTGNIEAAISCLEQAVLVCPCPHNTSFGLDMRLCNALTGNEKAIEAVKEYQYFAKEFIRA